jgi:CspA family cold shock protein
MKGTIIRLVDKGFGFIRGEDNKEYFFHRSAIKNAQFEALRDGTEVEFNESQGNKGPRAEDVFV